MYVRDKRRVVVGDCTVVETKSGLFYAVIGGFCTKLFGSLDDLIATYPVCAGTRDSIAQ